MRKKEYETNTNPDFQPGQQAPPPAKASRPLPKAAPTKQTVMKFIQLSNC